MKEVIRFGFILTLICIVAAGLLAGVNSLTKERTLAQAQAEEKASLKAVIPQGMHFEPVKKEEQIIYYKAFDKDGKFIGVAFKTQAKGYASIIEAIVGMLKDGTITSVKILSQNETPGLGSRIVEPAFITQFTRKKDLSAVQAITGATISSKAVIDSVKKKTEDIKALIKDGK